MSTYIRLPVTGGVPTYVDEASLPATATDGSLAITLDTDTLWIFNSGTSTWLSVGGSSVPLSVGTLDGQAVNAQGAAIALNQIFMQSADATHPGLINTSAQSIAGAKTFTGAISASNLSGTNSGDVTLGTANGLSIVGQALSLGLSSSSTTGALSSTDWSTFNNKQASGNYITALTSDITASGPGSVAATLATVNSNVGSFGSASSVATFTVNAKGLTTAAASTSIQIAESQVTNLVSDLAGKQPAGNYITALTGDITASGPGSVAATLATVNANVGSFGSSTSIPNFTVNAKGLLTAAGSNVVIAPAGTLTGTTLASNVVTSSLTTVGTIGTGTWAGTTIAVNHGGTGLATLTANNVMLGNGTSTPLFVAPSTSGNVLTSNGTTWTSAAPSSGSVVAYLYDQKSSGTGGGSSNGDSAWHTRDLNTEVDSGGIVSLSANQFTLQAGTYEIFSTSPQFASGIFKSRIQNITDSTTAIIGSSEFAGISGISAQASSIGLGTFTIAGAKVFEIQYYCNSSEATNGLGNATGSGIDEVYTQIKITKVG